MALGEQVLGNETNTKISEDGYTWISVLYINDDTITKGYICADYLEKQGTLELNTFEFNTNNENIFNFRNSSTKIEQKVLDNTSLSTNGRVVGIDVGNYVSATQLKSLFTAQGNVIETSISGTDTSDIAGKINYVYIKIGASPYGKEANFSPIENKNYKELVAVCEELGIPYGFYYYSTSITKEEAEIEAEFIEEAIKSLDETNYNLLPIALDYEVCSGTSDRQYGLDLTEIKAYLANLVEANFGKTIVYGNGRALSPKSSEQIIDIARYNNLIVTGDSMVWLAMPRKSNGTISSNLQQMYDLINEQSEIGIEQTLLDVSVNGVTVDVNVMDESVYISLIKGEYQEQEKTSNENEEITKFADKLRDILEGFSNDNEEER